MRNGIALLILCIGATAVQAIDGVAFRHRVAYGRSSIVAGSQSFSPKPNGTDWVVPFESYSGSFVSQSYGAVIRLAGILNVGFEAGVQSMIARQRRSESLPYLDPDGNVVDGAANIYASVSVYDAFTRLSLAVDLPGDFYVEAGASSIINANNQARSGIRFSPPELGDRVDFAPINSFDEYVPPGFTGNLPDFPKVRSEVDANIGKFFVIGDARIQLLATYRHGLTNLTSFTSLRNSSIAGSIGFEYAL